MAAKSKPRKRAPRKADQVVAGALTSSKTKRAPAKAPAPFPPRLADVEKVLGPAREWTGRCYEIATALVDRGFVEGVAVYGHWIGPVNPHSFFRDRRQVPFIQHGWVQVRGNPELILDPTRWAFTAEDPFIYFGPNRGEYDESGNRWHKAMRRPCPRFDRAAEKFHYLGPHLLSSAAWARVGKLLGPNYLVDITGEDDGAQHHPIGDVTAAQLFWLANAAYEDLQPFAKEIYAAIESCGKRAAIPIDNYRRAERS